MTTEQIGRLLEAAAPNTTIYLVGVGGCGDGGAMGDFAGRGFIHRGTIGEVRVEAEMVGQDPGAEMEIRNYIVGQQRRANRGGAARVADEHGTAGGVVDDFDGCESAAILQRQARVAADRLDRAAHCGRHRQREREDRRADPRRPHSVGAEEVVAWHGCASEWETGAANRGISAMKKL